MKMYNCSEVAEREVEQQIEIDAQFGDSNSFIKLGELCPRQRCSLKGSDEGRKGELGNSLN